MANAERDKPDPLSTSEQKAGLAAVAKLKASREEMLQQRKGVVFGDAAEELHKLILIMVACVLYPGDCQSPLQRLALKI